MKSVDLRKIRRAMEKTLDSKRYDHTLGVCYTASALAMCYGVNLLDAQIAGMLHDCAKCVSNKRKLTICEKHNINVNAIERQNPFLLHAKVGSFIAMEKYGIRNREIINAILNHMTGRPNMSNLEKIIFVADYIEPGRKQAPNLSEIRSLAFTDLNQAVLRILEDTLKYLNSVEGESIDPMTEKTYRFYHSQTDAIPG